MLSILWDAYSKKTLKYEGISKMVIFRDIGYVIFVKNSFAGPLQANKYQENACHRKRFLWQAIAMKKKLDGKGGGGRFSMVKVLNLIICWGVY